jgi:hypothetical protein
VYSSPGSWLHRDIVLAYGNGSDVLGPGMGGGIADLHADLRDMADVREACQNTGTAACDTR